MPPKIAVFSLATISRRGDTSIVESLNTNS